MILVTGHLGFIGSYLFKEISAIGMDIKNNYNNILFDNLPDADIVIHLAAQTDVILSVENPINDANLNILGTIRLVQHYKKSKFIFVSSGGAIQEKIESPYGLSKYCAEEYIKLLHDNYIILRLPNIYGKGSRSVVEKFINGPVNIYGDGYSTRDYVHVSDIVKAIKMSFDWKVGTYSLGSCKNYSVLDLARATGKPINFLPERKGELKHSFVENTSEWKPAIDVIDYIKKKILIRL
jgi:UDP-glucose 4-epimerase